MRALLCCLWVTLLGACGLDFDPFRDASAPEDAFEDQLAPTDGPARDMGDVSLSECQVSDTESCPAPFQTCPDGECLASNGLQMTAGEEDLVVEAGTLVICNTSEMSCIRDETVIWSLDVSSNPRYAVLRARNIEIDGNFIALGARPLIVAASGDFRMGGGFAAESLIVAGAGAGLRGQGESPPTGPGRGMDPGGGGGYGGPGGAGLGAGGEPYGNDAIVPLLGGSGGAASENIGGHGGGAVQISALGSITVTGAFGASGDGGARGGGGGSGGAIIFESRSVTLGSTARIHAAGGGGGGLNAGPNLARGIRATATSPGRGGVGDVGTGGEGSGPRSAAEDGEGGGGGGGGPGRIRVNGPLTNSARVNPAFETATVTVSDHVTVREGP